MCVLEWQDDFFLAFLLFLHLSGCNIFGDRMGVRYFSLCSCPSHSNCLLLGMRLLGWKHEFLDFSALVLVLNELFMRSLKSRTCLASSWSNLSHLLKVESRVAVISSHLYMWLVVGTLDSTDIWYFCHCRKSYWTALLHSSGQFPAHSHNGR